MEATPLITYIIKLLNYQEISNEITSNMTLKFKHDLLFDGKTIKDQNKHRERIRQYMTLSYRHDVIIQT